jgi:cytochrome c
MPFHLPSRGRLLALTLPAALLAVLALPVAASPTLAQQKNCMTCHAVATRIVGPSYKEVAAKYAGQTDAAAQLAERISKGSTGRWGPMPMPNQPQVSASEAQVLAAWILEQK